MTELDVIAAVTLDDIRAAAGRLAGKAVRTPLLESPLLNARIGGRLLVKPEVLQRTGSFKFRGAYNAISQIAPADRAKGVLAFSSGNHAQGVASAAQLLGMPATIVMPHDAPAIKRANTEAYGARVVTYRRPEEDREAVSARIQVETGATLVRPYEDLRVIAGQGTVGLEIAEDVTEAGIALDAVIVCTGGGGLTAGVATAVDACLPGTAVYAAEPAGFDDTVRSLAAGRRLGNDPQAHTICDAIMTPTPGETTFAINSRLVAGGFVVTDAEVAEAMRVAFDTLKLVVEPGGAVALASALSSKLDCAGRTVAVVLSGGNVDAALYAEVLAGRIPG
ncbi:MAG: threonine/serine dehydratase [Alphaproteobacteria bacterium]